MTDVLLICKAGGAFDSLRADGHAGFLKRGSDIVCAAETMLFRTVLSLLEKTDGLEVKKDISKRGSLFFCVKGGGTRSVERLVCVADFIREGMQSLAEEYPRNVRFNEVVSTDLSTGL